MYWYPTHFAQNAKWMGHGAFVGLAEKRTAVGLIDKEGRRGAGLLACC
jgi:hypothetical protein